ncbi:hypothetical protein F4805DRAFT_411753 [Annulohypoxylon moriforme]|nr:hypothetical protein F4805DRAFT_411753 [Annulohypoxylon moriforme]
MSPNPAVPNTPHPSPTMRASAGPDLTTLANEPLPVLAINGEPMDKDQGSECKDRPSPDSHLRPSTQRLGGDGDNVKPVDAGRSHNKPPIFGSTSHKEGMNEAMAKLNLNQNSTDKPQVASTNEDKKKKKRSFQALLRLPFERKPPTPVWETAEYQQTRAAIAQLMRELRADADQTQPRAQRRRLEEEKKAQSQPQQQPKPKGEPTLPSISELPEDLAEHDKACRRASMRAQCWSSEAELELWQQVLVAKLVCAKHAQLDKTQNLFLCYARRCTRARPLELWYEVRRVRIAQEKAKARKAKMLAEAEKKRIQEEEEKRKKSAEAMVLVHKILSARARQRAGDPRLQGSLMQY